MATDIITIAWVALLVWLAIECRHVHQLNKKADKLIEEMEKEIEGDEALQQMLDEAVNCDRESEG